MQETSLLGIHSLGKQTKVAFVALFLTSLLAAFRVTPLGGPQLIE